MRTGDPQGGTPECFREALANRPPSPRGALGSVRARRATSPGSNPRLAPGRAPGRQKEPIRTYDRNLSRGEMLASGSTLCTSAP
jgi:hypothetical protein